MKNKTQHILSHVLRWIIMGVLYCILEICWRGHTHWSMFLLAMFLAIPLDIANDFIPWNISLTAQAVLGGLVVTTFEFLTGLVVNIWLGFGVWDYSNQFGNVLGQICPLYTVFWMLLCIPAIVTFDWLEYKLCGGEVPHYNIIGSK